MKFVERKRNLRHVINHIQPWPAYTAVCKQVAAPQGTTVTYGGSDEKQVYNP